MFLFPLKLDNQAKYVLTQEFLGTITGTMTWQLSWSSWYPEIKPR